MFCFCLFYFMRLVLLLNLFGQEKQKKSNENVSNFSSETFTYVNLFFFFLIHHFIFPCYVFPDIVLLFSATTFDTFRSGKSGDRIWFSGSFPLSGSRSSSFIGIWTAGFWSDLCQRIQLQLPNRDRNLSKMSLNSRWKFSFWKTKYFNLKYVAIVGT